MQGCKTSTYFEEFILGKTGKKEKGEKEQIQYSMKNTTVLGVSVGYFGCSEKGHLTKTWESRESGKLSEAVTPG